MKSSAGRRKSAADIRQERSGDCESLLQDHCFEVTGAEAGTGCNLRVNYSCRCFERDCLH